MSCEHMRTTREQCLSQAALLLRSKAAEVAWLGNQQRSSLRSRSCDALQELLAAADKERSLTRTCAYEAKKSCRSCCLCISPLSVVPSSYLPRHWSIPNRAGCSSLYFRGCTGCVGKHWRCGQSRKCRFSWDRLMQYPQYCLRLAFMSPGS